MNVSKRLLNFVTTERIQLYCTTKTHIETAHNAIIWEMKTVANCTNRLLPGKIIISTTHLYSTIKTSAYQWHKQVH